MFRFSVTANHLVYHRKSMASDFVSFFTKKEPDIMVDSGNVEVTTSTPKLAASDTEQPKQKDKEEAPNHPGWDKLVHFTDDNHKNLLLQHKHLLIMFHAKWCEHCKDLKPIFAEVAQSQDSDLATLAACDVDVSPKMVDDFLIDSLPTLKYVRDGKSVLNYSGERTAAAIKVFLQKMKNEKDEL